MSGAAVARAVKRTYNAVMMALSRIRGALEDCVERRVGVSGEH